ncbi:MAG: 2-C-methyl-D-erythritol 4-phosphate cytidylyltransferase [Coriobacteriia bacterium]|nr:2-C-methyl-D-erythritol 4-phosphate cytidylyltransferase [Coriobacteriia bacterium]MCL2537718.1 2-C-methyl-D-erythritol 4-phosphate cytidylyltransferase [Coriobacteriia bacterium]
MLKITGIIAAGGTGSRLGVAGGKQLLELAGKPVAAWAVDALAAADLIQKLVIVCDPDRVDLYARSITAAVATTKPLAFVAGGDTREDSVLAGLDAASDACIVAVHDGARPLLDPAAAEAAIQMLLDDKAADGVVLANQAVDTLKRVGGNTIIDTPDRSLFWHAQTPQVFLREKLLQAYVKGIAEGFCGTDDASYVEHAGGVVRVIAGSRNNIKVTTQEDVEFVHTMLGGGRLT